MKKSVNWTRDELIVAINLYLRTPFGKIHSSNPEILRLATVLGRTANAVSYKLANFASIDPSLERRGATHYSKLDKQVWNEFFDDWDLLIMESEVLYQEHGLRNPDPEQDGSYPIGEDRSVIGTTRTKQSFFRNSVLAAYDHQCCVTGLEVSELLVASHIIPWAHDKTHRLNPRNGLCLNAVHDRAFDQGLFTITDDYVLTISDYLRDRCKNEFGKTCFLLADKKKIKLLARFRPDPEFLEYHRNNIFKH